MNRHNVELLQKIRGYPSLTITMPSHRQFPENKQDAVRLKNLIARATDRLLKEFGKRDIPGLLHNLDEAMSSVDHNMNMDGIALFANNDIFRVYQLPFTPMERVVVDETFLTRDLVYSLNRSSRYWLLVLSKKPTRLFEGFCDNVVEVKEGGFPMEHTGPGGSTALPGGKGARKSAYRDENHQKFFRAVNTALAEYMSDDPLPLVITGVDKFISLYKDISSFPIVGVIKGSHGRTAAHELGKTAWPLMEEHLSGRRGQVLGELAKAVKDGTVLSTIGGIWPAVLQGRGKTLLVEEGFHYPATVDESGMKIEPSENPEAPGVIDDAVDEIIEAVIAARGDVVFVPDGTLTEHQRMALMLRF
ncbi:MAG: hypothetical protein R6V62_07950 [Candidatus Fermentibacteraceae bacterium]